MRCMTSLKKNIKYIAVVIILILISGTLYLGAIRIYELEKKVRSQEYMIYELEDRLDNVKKLADKAMYYIKSLHTYAEFEANIGENF
jgi:cell division protein FtsL